MKKLISFLVFAFVLAIASNLSAQTPTKDVVYLKNGSIVKGIITEINPNVNLKIKTIDGSIFVFEMKDIEKVIKEETVANQQLPVDDNNKSVVTNSKHYKDPVISTVCSFLFPGIGQFYNGQPTKGAGHLVWNIVSNVVLWYSLNQMTYMGYYGEPVFTPDSDKWGLIAVVAGISGLSCWIVSMVDANQTSKAINRQLGLASFQLGERANLSFNPDIRLVNDYSLMNSKTISPSYGLNMRISF